jgi:hypothetical protein
MMISSNQGGTVRPASAKSVAEKLKADGVAEQQRGAELQQDGVDLQQQGADEQKIGEQAKKFGQFVKENGQAVVAAGQEQVAAGEQAIEDGQTQEKVARESENAHTASFSGALDTAKAARQSADANVAKIENGLTTEKAAVEQQSGELGKFAANLVEAGAILTTSKLVQKKVAEGVAAEKEAFAGAEAGTVTFKEGLDKQAAGRAISSDGRNDLSKSDLLKDQSEQATNRSNDYGRRASAHLTEAGNLKEEADAHAEASGTFENLATGAEAASIVAGAASAEQNALAELLAAKAEIDFAAAEGLAEYSEFKDESKRTNKEGFTAVGQSVSHTQKGKYYATLEGSLIEESQALTGQSESEASEQTRKLFSAGERGILAAGDGARSLKHGNDAAKYNEKSAEFKATGDEKVARGGAQQSEGTAIVEAGLGQISTSTAAQEATHAGQTNNHTTLDTLNNLTLENITSREGSLAIIKDSGKTQGSSLLEQTVGLGGLVVDQKIGQDSHTTRTAEVANLKQDAASIAAGLAAVEEGLVTRTEGADIVDKGVKAVNFGQAAIDKGDELIEDGVAHAESGRQKEEAGKVIADKGSKYVGLADKTLNPGGQTPAPAAQAEEVAKQAAEIPYHLA